MQDIINTKEEAINEANRCLGCAIPNCVKGCPLMNNIPQYISCIKNDDIQGAYDELLETTILSEICGKVCPSDKYCMAKCVRGLKDRSVNIRGLERFVSKSVDKKFNNCIVHNEKIAIIGTGPSSIMCAYFLLRSGYKVTMFEKEKIFGGLLSYGIPKHRLEKESIEKVQTKLIHMGVEIKYSTEFGKDINMENLLNMGYMAIYLGTGLTTMIELNVDGEELGNIYNGNDFLYHMNLNDGYIDRNIIENKVIVVVGGGSVALDVATTVMQFKPKSVEIMYRRTENELLINNDEVQLAKKSGVKFQYLTSPMKFFGNGKIEKIECVKMKLGDVDDTGRRKPIIEDGSNFVVEADVVVNCLGSKYAGNNLGLKEKDGILEVSENGQTSVPYVFAGGDICNSKEKTVAFAGRLGVNAAKGIVAYLKNI